MLGVRCRTSDLQRHCTSSIRKFSTAQSTYNEPQHKSNSVPKLETSLNNEHKKKFPSHTEKSVNQRLETCLVNIIDNLTLQDPSMSLQWRNYKPVGESNRAQSFVYNYLYSVRRSLELKKWLEKSPNGDPQDFYNSFVSTDDQINNLTPANRLLKVHAQLFEAFNLPLPLQSQKALKDITLFNPVTPEEAVSSSSSSSPSPFESSSPFESPSQAPESSSLDLQHAKGQALTDTNLTYSTPPRTDPPAQKATKQSLAPFNHKAPVPENILAPPEPLMRSLSRALQGAETFNVRAGQVPSRFSRHSGNYERLVPYSHVSLYKSHKPLPKKYGIIDSRPTYEIIEVEQKSEVPTLKHSLSKVLFSPGVHYLQDPRTKVFNFNPILKNILPINEFDFQHVTQFITSAKDKKMLEISEEHGTKYYSSTSSMTGVLSHLHYLLSNFRPVFLGDFSKHIRGPPQSQFTKGAKLPASIIVRKIGDKFAIDSDKSSDREMILSMLGHSLERLLTSTPEDFEKYKLINESEENSKAQIELERKSSCYHYAKMGKFAMRSQLDCKHPQLPGTGTFDLKTRAVAAIRYDLAAYENETSGYELIKTVGEYESFERELKELAKSTLIKYSLQARIGNMDGIFIAFHNISKIFGFQYLPLTTIDQLLHGVGKPDFSISVKRYKDDPNIITDGALREKLTSKLAHDEFTISMKMYEDILDFVSTTLFKDTSFRLTFKATQVGPYDTALQVVAHPVTEEDIGELQTSIYKSSKAVATGNIQGIDEHVAKTKKLNARLSKKARGFRVLVNHKINGLETSKRHPVYYSEDDKWEVEYKFTMMSKETSRLNLNMHLNEKLNLLLKTGQAKDDDEVGIFVKILRDISREGKRRAAVNDKEERIVWNKEE